MSELLKIRRQTQVERRAESEQRLLTAAAELIATEGFAAASLERVGAAAGYSRGLASQKFGSKDGLVTAVIAAEADVDLDACGQPPADHQDGAGPLELVERLLEGEAVGNEFRFVSGTLTRGANHRGEA